MIHSIIESIKNFLNNFVLSESIDHTKTIKASHPYRVSPPLLDEKNKIKISKKVKSKINMKNITNSFLSIFSFLIVLMAIIGAYFFLTCFGNFSCHFFPKFFNVRCPENIPMMFSGMVFLIIFGFAYLVLYFIYLAIYLTSQELKCFIQEILGIKK